jgi:dihydroorotase-like cyclic amidohydrolase
LMLDAVSKGYLSYPRLVEVCSKIPAFLYGLYPRKGILQIGSDADFILVDPEATWTLEDKNILSKAGWTPYAGYHLKGRVVATFVRGLKVAEGGRCVGPIGWGQFVPGRDLNG